MTLVPTVVKTGQWHPLLALAHAVRIPEERRVNGCRLPAAAPLQILLQVKLGAGGCRGVITRGPCMSSTIRQGTCDLDRWSSTSRSASSSSSETHKTAVLGTAARLMVTVLGMSMSCVLRGEEKRNGHEVRRTETDLGISGLANWPAGSREPLQTPASRCKRSQSCLCRSSTASYGSHPGTSVAGVDVRLARKKRRRLLIGINSLSLGPGALFKLGAPLLRSGACDLGLRETSSLLAPDVDKPHAQLAIKRSSACKPHVSRTTPSASIDRSKISVTIHKTYLIVLCRRRGKVAITGHGQEHKENRPTPMTTGHKRAQHPRAGDPGARKNLPPDLLHAGSFSSLDRVCCERCCER